MDDARDSTPLRSGRRRRYVPGFDARDEYDPGLLTQFQVKFGYYLYMVLTPLFTKVFNCKNRIKSAEYNFSGALCGNRPGRVAAAATWYPWTGSSAASRRHGDAAVAASEPSRPRRGRSRRANVPTRIRSAAPPPPHF